MKQVLIMRSDLGMGKGKLVAQGAHASMMFMFSAMVNAVNSGDQEFAFPEELEHWFLESGMCKICLKADSLEQLEQLEVTARAAGLIVHKITDAARTTFSEPTITCLAIGPNEEEAIDKVTGNLKLL